MQVSTSLRYLQTRMNILWPAMIIPLHNSPVYPNVCCGLHPEFDTFRRAQLELEVGEVKISIKEKEIDLSSVGSRILVVCMLDLLHILR